VRELAWLGIPMRVIPNVIDLSDYPYHHRSRLQPNLFWMRTFHWMYRPELAVKVLLRLHSQFPAAKLTMAGLDKGLLPSVKKLAEELKLMDSISFPGFLDKSAKIEFARQHDVYLTTNVVDNVPVSVIEMAAMGLPIVSTNAGGLPDLLTDGVNSLVVQTDDEQAMTEAVIRLLHDQELAAKLSINGRRLAERFSWEKVGPLWDALIGQAVHVPLRGI
jgi:glycosyltransferase involved in cell wall biosynthesis